MASKLFGTASRRLLTSRFVFRNSRQIIKRVRSYPFLQEVVVGDIALLEPGEIVPVDGIFISGHHIKCDESGATGESDAIKKAPYGEVFQIHRDAQLQGKDASHGHTDCFMISGSKILEGVGKYVVVAVGTKSFNGRIMMGSFASSNWKVIILD